MKKVFNSVPNEPTHYPYCANGRPKKPDIIDFALMKNFNYVINTEVIGSDDSDPNQISLDSDHLPVLHTIDLECSYNVGKAKYNYSKINLDKFNESLRDCKLGNV